MITHENKKTQKPVAWFEKAQKGFVMNSTNAHIIAALYGDDTSDWLGQRITIYPTKVKAFGTMQDCIRVKEEIPAMPKPVAQAAQVEDQSDLDDDEDVADYDDLNMTIDPETGEIMSGDALFAKDEPSNGKQPGTLSQAQLTRLHILGADVYGSEWPQYRPGMVDDASNGRVKRSKDLSPAEASVLINNLELKLKAHARNGVHA
jgi:hypothetical protein